MQPAIKTVQDRKRGMVLPFEQHSITFDGISYSVDMPQVNFNFMKSNYWTLIILEHARLELLNEMICFFQEVFYPMVEICLKEVYWKHKKS